VLREAPPDINSGFSFGDGDEAVMIAPADDGVDLPVTDLGAALGGPSYWQNTKLKTIIRSTSPKRRPRRP
jgi:hypothetical protein